MQFNPNDYETVKSRKKRFYEKYPEGRIVVKLVNPETTMSHAIIKCFLFKDQTSKCFATGYAMEVRDTDLKTTNNGKKYESVNFTSWLENAEESAVGRALDNGGFSGNLKCTREEMEKAQRQSQTLQKQITNPLDLEILGLIKQHGVVKGAEQWQKYDDTKKMDMIIYYKTQLSARKQ
jgi:hypothetical protein